MTPFYRCCFPSAGPWEGGTHPQDLSLCRPAKSHGMAQVSCRCARSVLHPDPADVSVRTSSRFRERPQPGGHTCAVLGGPLPGRQLPGLQPEGPMVWVTEDIRAPHWRDRTGVQKSSCSAWKKVDDRRAIIYTPESPQDRAKLGLFLLPLRLASSPRAPPGRVLHKSPCTHLFRVSPCFCEPDRRGAM